VGAAGGAGPLELRGPAHHSPTAADDERLARAHALLEDARPAEALALADEVLAHRDDEEARLVAAYAHADLGDLDSAAAGALAVLATNPLCAPARYLLGTLRKQQGDAAAALVELRRTLYADPDFALAHFALANLHRQRGESADAAREYACTMRVLEAAPEGGWTAFLGGFTPEVLHETCKRGLKECMRRAPAPKDASRTGR
jgi:tetratricopeptide (TPR) repeat protein